MELSLESRNCQPGADRVWFALDVTLVCAAEEAVQYALMEAGSSGTESGLQDGDLCSVIAYFPSLPDRERVRQELNEALQIYGLPTSAVRNMVLREVANQDWLSEWKKSWSPVTIGHLIVGPPWAKVVPQSGQAWISIEPGMAFGTGTHETTRLCLQAIQKYFEGGSLLDVGTGTGVLAIAAAKLYPQAVIDAFDIDEQAIAIARGNALLNEVRNIKFHLGTIDGVIQPADLVCANLTADTIIFMLDSLLSLTGRWLILSGILENELQRVRARLSELDVVETQEIVIAGEWVCMVV